MPSIVATILSGNGRPLIQPAMHSALDHCDCFVLIDTGITDRTREVAERLLGERLVLEKFAWCEDFAAARNFALEAAAKHGAVQQRCHRARRFLAEYR
jgi:hypothetical protein